MLEAGERRSWPSTHPGGESSQEEGDSSAHLLEEAEAGADKQGNMKVR